MLIAWQNLADAASVSTDSEVATLPASNVQQAHVSRQWQTDGDNAAYLLLDLGSSLSCALLALLGTNLTSSATIRIRGSVTDATATGSLAYDSGTVAAGAKAGYGAVYKDFASVASRYWRIDLSDATLDELAVGRLFLGPSWEPSINMQMGWSSRVADPSRRSKSSGGQSYADVRPKARVLEFVLDCMTEAEMYGNAFALAYAQGITGDVLAIPDIDGSYLSEQAVFGLLSANEPIVEPRLGLYSQKFSIEERL
jgi:hypothetical protein